MFEVLSDFSTNTAITVPILAWFIAQGFKFFHYFLKNGKVDFKKFIHSGGMPSSHTSFTVCLTTVVGCRSGFSSDVFAVAVIFSLVVMADAAGVRRAAGKQAEVLNKLVNSTGHVQVEKQLKELLGHTPVEVLVGAALGIFLGVWLA